MKKVSLSGILWVLRLLTRITWHDSSFPGTRIIIPLTILSSRVRWYAGWIGLSLGWLDPEVWRSWRSLLSVNLHHNAIVSERGCDLWSRIKKKIIRLKKYCDKEMRSISRDWFRKFRNCTLPQPQIDRQVLIPVWRHQSHPDSQAKGMRRFRPLTTLCLPLPLIVPFLSGNDKCQCSSFP